MTYNEIKKEYETKLSEIMEKNELFWAFNDEQMKEGIEKYNISKENKVCSIGMGGYLPFKNYKSYIADMTELNKWEKAEKKALKENKKEQEKAILYELNNFECFYTGDLTNVFEIFPNIDKKEIYKVYSEAQVKA
jgi:hypothetical protein